MSGKSRLYILFITNSMEKRLSLECYSLSATEKKACIFIDHEKQRSCPQTSATSPYPEPGGSSLSPRVLCL